MYGASNGYNAYKKNSVNFASKDQLLLMLVDGAVKFSKLAKQSLEEKNIVKSHENLVKTQNIFYELMATLDVEKGGEWAENLMRIYDFIISELMQANMKKDVNILNKVLPVIEDVRDTWHEAYKRSKVG